MGRNRPGRKRRLQGQVPPGRSAKHHKDWFALGNVADHVCAALPEDLYRAWRNLAKPSQYRGAGDAATSPKVVKHLATDPSVRRSLRFVSGKSERRLARSVLAEYHQTQLGMLIAQVGSIIDRFRAGELDAFHVDRSLLQYSRAAKELWKFCNYVPGEVAASMIQREPPAGGGATCPGAAE